MNTSFLINCFLHTCWKILAEFFDHSKVKFWQRSASLWSEGYNDSPRILKLVISTLYQCFWQRENLPWTALAIHMDTFNRNEIHSIKKINTDIIALSISIQYWYYSEKTLNKEGFSWIRMQSGAYFQNFKKSNLV